MNYRLYFLCLLAIFLDSFILLPLLGARESFLVIVFLASLIVTVKDHRTLVLVGLLACLTQELLTGANFGVFMLSFLTALILYAWFDNFLSLRPSNYRQERVWRQLLSDFFSAIFLVYFLSFFVFAAQKIFYEHALGWNKFFSIFYSGRSFVFITVGLILVLPAVEYINNKRSVASSISYVRT